jgi:glycosyltransferase involved in cell wall biosynthesis
MGYILSYPGVMEHAEQIALSLQEDEALQAFVTSFAFKEPSALASATAVLPQGLHSRVLAQLRRRTIRHVDSARVRTIPAYEVLRTAMQKAGAGPVIVDRIWDAGAQHFDRTVARRLPGSDGVLAFEYGALETFRRAKDLGLPTILHVPSLENRAYRALMLREMARFPELRSHSDERIDKLFEQRQARREAEIALADVIIANSSLTRNSHLAAGAPADKVQVALLGAPEALPQATPRPVDGPLVVLWSGSFILRKGAHYLLDAWRALGAGPYAELRVYGHVGLPERLLAQAPPGVAFMGSIPRAQMMQAYAEADVLVFPTLSDGFGLCVTEALSQGLPVISTDQAGAADLLEPGQSGLIVPAADAPALTDALRWCLDNRTQLAAMRPMALAAATRRPWSRFRRDHAAALACGLARAGFKPRFASMAS